MNTISSCQSGDKGPDHPKLATFLFRGEELRLCIDSDTLLLSIRNEDFPGQPSSAIPSLKEMLATEAFGIVLNNTFDKIVIEPIQVRNKKAYKINSPAHSIVLRCLNSAVRQSARVLPADRDTIIRQLVRVLKEGVPHRVYKFDIKAFFESVNAGQLCEQIYHDLHISRSASTLIRSYFDQLAARGITGIPRGIPLSATLAEYILHPFDTYVSRLPEVYYYARFVDDIVIVTGARESAKQFENSIARALPFSLRFNSSKTRIIDVPVQRQSNGQRAVGTFDYLGYSLSIHETAKQNGRLSRAVDITIAPKKTTRLKTRLCCAVAQFVGDSNANALHKRLQILTGNYNVRDAATGRRRNVGLYCNYRQANNFDSLHELDNFLRSLVIGNRSQLSRRFSATASQRQRRSLLIYSFAESYRRRTFYHIRPQDLAALTKCWRHV